MHIHSLKIILLVALFACAAMGQTVQSTTAGGNWEDGNTWTGGVVPSASNDVVINGAVSITSSGEKCRNLTIQSAGVLQNGGPNGWVTPVISGNITNNGAIRNNPAGNELWLELAGDVHNNGSWQPARCNVASTTLQIISQTVGHPFDSPVTRKSNTGGVLRAGSDLTFNKRVSLYGADSWTELDMQGYAMNLGPEAYLENLTIRNAGVMNFAEGAYIQSGTIDGTPAIDGTCSINSSNIYFNGPVTVDGILQNGGGLGWVTPQFSESLANYGTVRNNPDGNRLVIELEGNLHNAGIWELGELKFTGAEQIITQATGAAFNSPLYRRSNAGGALLAGSDLTFNKRVSLYAADSWNVLDMQGHAMSLGPEAYLENLIVQNAGVMYFAEGAYIQSGTIDGTPALDGTCSINSSNIYFTGPTTVEGILQNSGGLGWVTPQFSERLTNNGTIRSNPAGNELWIEAYGDIHNNGDWRPARFYVASDTLQFISQTEGHPFDSEVTRKSNTSGTLRAASDLTFNRRVNMYGSGGWEILDMAGYNASFGGEAYLDNTILRNAAGMHFEPGGGLTNTSISGAAVFTGTCSIYNSEVYVHDKVIVQDTIQNGGSLGWVYLRTYGEFINNGVVRNNPAGNELWIESFGDLLGMGVYRGGRVYLNTNGADRSVSGIFNSSVTFKMTGDPAAGIFRLTGETTNYGRFQVNGGAHLQVGPGAVFYHNGDLSGSISNRGNVYTTRVMGENESFDFFKLSASLLQGSDIDSMTVEAYGNQAPASFGNAALSWWRVSPYHHSKRKVFPQITLTYEDELLNGNDEETLEVFHSTDAGETWKQLSTSLNTERNANNNTVTMTDAPAYGDYILSADGNPYSMKPSLIVTSIGRTQFRIGPPNRYTIHYVNNSLVPTDDFLITVSVGANMHIKEAHLPMEDGSIEVVPADSINMEPDHSVAMFYLAGLDPGEEGSFDLILGGVPLERGTPDEVAIDPFTIIVGGIIVWAGVKTIDYLGDKAKENVEEWEVLTPEQEKQYDREFKISVQEDIKKDKKRGKKVWVIRKIGIKIIEKSMGVVGGAVETVAAIGRNIWKVGTSLRHKVWQFLYKDSGLYGVENTYSGSFVPDISANQKPLEGTTSWDPNEKAGPSGYGPQNHITSAGKMPYTIFFENKAEATAPAWQIVIVDTLSDVFDPASVEFGPTSHSGWDMKREGNILTWSITGIELPPNVNPPEGEGWVRFSVKTLDDLPSGTEIANRATIVFDLNKPIMTNTVVNTLDFEAPVTTMSSELTVEAGDSLLVQWSAEDGVNESGIGSTTIFCSVDDGAFTTIGSTPLSSFKYRLHPGTHSYRFYALSTDNVGNVEATAPAEVSVSSITSADEEEALPDDYALFQNYPNPFNPVTTIRYSLPEEAMVTLAVYNILGEQVHELVHEVQRAGIHYANFNASHLASGPYFYRITAGRFTETRKLLLLK